MRAPAAPLRICDVIREAQPKVIVTHWRGSMHKDHTAAADNLPDALFYAALPAFQRALPPHRVGRCYFGENWEDLRGYEPEVFLEVLPEDVETRERAMRCCALFHGEVSPFPYLDYYRSLAQVRRNQAVARFSQGFGTGSSPRERLRRAAISTGSRTRERGASGRRVMSTR
jgi:N-acetylglucosamine malate deacetylase 1